jgi:hypothetical protein
VIPRLAAALGGACMVAACREGAALALRVLGQHGVTVQYLAEQRDARPSVEPRFRQSRRTLGVLYTFLGPAGFGAIE